MWLIVIRFLFFSFLFLSLHDSFFGMGGALMNRCTPRKCWPAPTLPHVTLFATRSFPTFVGEGAFRTPPGGGVLQEFLGGDVLLGPWNPYPIPEIVQLNFATLY